MIDTLSRFESSLKSTIKTFKDTPSYSLIKFIAAGIETCRKFLLPKKKIRLCYLYSKFQRPVGHTRSRPNVAVAHDLHFTKSKETVDLKILQVLFSAKERVLVAESGTNDTENGITFKSICFRADMLSQLQVLLEIKPNPVMISRAQNDVFLPV